MANIMPVLFDAAPEVNYYTYFKNLGLNDGGLNNYLNIIAGCDSLHDFNDKGGRVPNATWDAVSGNLLENLNSLYLNLNPNSNVRFGDFATWTKSMSGNQITPSSIEDKTVSYFESNYQPQLRGTTVLLTYRQVINKIKSFMSIQYTKINDAILQANLNLCNGAQILEIDMEAGEVWDMAYTTQDKLYIGLFLLNFYFPPTVTTSSSTGASPSSTTHNGDVDVDYNTRLQTYMTFDAGSNIPSKIFGLLNQVINLVTPLNIADSATESQHLAVDISQKRAGVKNKYVFPINNDDGSDGRYIYSSNIFTMKEEEGIQLSITPPSGEYGETNKYNFSINVANIPPPPPPNPLIPNPCELVKFTTIDENGTTTYKSGPGVEYLSECINKDFKSAAPAITTIAPIASNCADDSTNKALYFDLKRSGDWEQCLAALTVNKFMDGVQKGRVILCTIDRLCGLFSRCIGQNTLYHYGTRLILYRYDVSLTSKQIEAAQAAAQAAAAAAAEAAAQAAAAVKNEVEEAYKKFDKNFIDNFTISKFKKPKDEKSLHLYNLINYFARKLVMNGLNKLNDAGIDLVFIKKEGSSLADNDDSSDTQGNGSGSIDVEDTDFSLADNDGFSATQSNGSSHIVEEYSSLAENRKRKDNTDSDTDNNKRPKYNQNYSTYFSKLKEITGIYVNSINYQPFIDNIKGFFNKLNNLQALPSGIFCDYNSEMLINLFLKLQQIVVFNRLARQTKSLGIDNYKMLLESAGVFDTLELILNNSSHDDVKLKEFVENFKKVQFVPADAAPVPGVTELNINYYEKLKLILDTYITEAAAAEREALEKNTQGPMVLEEREPNQTGGNPLSEKEQVNGSDTLMFELTTLFMSLTVNLNELTETLFLVPPGFQGDYNKFFTDMKSKNIPDTYTYKILQILDNFFRESWFAIKKAEAVNLNTTKHKKIYYTVYIFFACLYGNINNDFISFLNQNNLYSNVQAKIENNINNVKKYLIVDNSFFNDYIDDEDDEINKILNALWFETDKLVYFKNIINYCINQRFANDDAVAACADATAAAAAADAAHAVADALSAAARAANARATRARAARTRDATAARARAARADATAANRAAADARDAADAARAAASKAPVAACKAPAAPAAAPDRPINNFVLTIFTTLFNFFNYCIYYSVRDAAAAAPSAAAAAPSAATDKDRGFNEGNIKISDFNESTTSFTRFIKKVIEINKLNKLNNIIESQELIFKKIYILLSIFSHYYQSSNKTIKQINELYGLSGGSKKYTKKIYNNRKNKTKHKSRNNKGGKRNTKKYNDKRKKRNTKRINNT